MIDTYMIEKPYNNITYLQDLKIAKEEAYRWARVNGYIDYKLSFETRRNGNNFILIMKVEG